MNNEREHLSNDNISKLELEFGDPSFLNLVRGKAPTFTRTQWALFLTAAQYYKPHQPYHNLNHAKNVVLAVLDIYDNKLTFLENPNISLLLAAMWHDAIYVPGSKYSELLSMKVMEYEALRTNARYTTNGPSILKLAKSLIDQTTISVHLREEHTTDPEELSILLDADLSGLASSYNYAFEEPADVVDRNYALFESIQMNIIQERIGDGELITEEHEQQSREFLKQFLNKKTIYRTPEAIAMWEDKARYNLTRYCYNHAT